MKRIALIIAIIALAGPLRAASYTVFRVCQDQHVIRTSDGAEAGRVEYILVDPEQQRIVSSVITGGVVGERAIAVPYADMEFSGERDIVLTNINRERIVSAPAIEVNRFASSTVVEPSVVEPSVTYFGGSSSSTTFDRTTNAETSTRAESRDMTGTAGTEGSAAMQRNENWRNNNAQHPNRDTVGSSNREEASPNANARMTDREDRNADQPRMGGSGGKNRQQTSPTNRHHQPQRRPSNDESRPSASATPGTSSATSPRSNASSSSRNESSKRPPAAASDREQSTERLNSSPDDSATVPSRHRPSAESSDRSPSQSRPHAQSRTSTDESSPSSSSNSSSGSATAPSAPQSSAPSNGSSERSRKTTTGTP